MNFELKEKEVTKIERVCENPKINVAVPILFIGTKFFKKRNLKSCDYRKVVIFTHPPEHCNQRVSSVDINDTFY